MDRLRRHGTAKILAPLVLVAGAGLGLFLFAVPAYQGEECTRSFGPVGATTSCVTDSATVIAVNPGAAPLLVTVTVLAAAAGVLALAAAWLRWTPARWMLGGLLVPLSVFAVLGLASIGAFILPVVGLGWVIFALCGPQVHRGAQS